mgnify:CR=1 FL=1
MKQSTHIRNLIIITVIAGAIGGIGNYFMIDVKSKTSILKPVVLGIIAAGVLPLFLKLVSSNILDFVEENLRHRNYAHFLSLCLLASLFADVFLQGIYAKVFHEFTEEIQQIDSKIDVISKKSSEATEKADPSWFGFLLTVKEGAPFSRHQFQTYMEKQKVQTRAYFTGNVMYHPGYRHLSKEYGELKKVFPNAHLATTSTLFLGTYSGLTEEKMNYIKEKVDAFFKELGA